MRCRYVLFSILLACTVFNCSVEEPTIINRDEPKLKPFDSIYHNYLTNGEILEINPIYDYLIFDQENKDIYPHVVNMGYIRSCYREIVILNEDTSKVIQESRGMVFPKGNLAPLLYNIKLPKDKYFIRYRLTNIKIGVDENELFAKNIDLNKKIELIMSIFKSSYNNNNLIF